MWKFFDFSNVLTHTFSSRENDVRRQRTQRSTSPLKKRRWSEITISNKMRLFINFVQQSMLAQVSEVGTSRQKPKTSPMHGCSANVLASSHEHALSTSHEQCAPCLENVILRYDSFIWSSGIHVLIGVGCDFWFGVVSKITHTCISFQSENNEKLERRVKLIFVLWEFWELYDASLEQLCDSVWKRWV